MKRIGLGIGFTAVATRAFMSCNEKRKKLVLGIRLAAIASTVQYAYNFVSNSPAIVKKLSIIGLGTGIAATAATAIYVVSHCNKKIKRLVLGIGLAAIASAVVKSSNIGLGTGKAATAQTAQKVTASPLFPAPVIRPTTVDLRTGIAAAANAVQTASNLIPKSTVTAPTPAATKRSMIAGLGTGISATTELAYGLLTNKNIHQLARVAAIAITIHTLYNLVRRSPVTPPTPPAPPHTPPAPPPPPPAVTPPRITQGTRTGLYTERSTEEIANLALISLL
jgi:hypothetical protein